MVKKSLKIITVLLLFFIANSYGADITSTGTGGSWSNGSTWVGGSVPTAADNVTIASGATVTIDADVEMNNLTINGTLVIGNDATSRSVVINGTTTIASGGAFTVGAFDITHIVNFKGGVTNDGTLDFYNSSSQVANVTFDGTFTVGGSNTPQFNSVKFNSGTVTAGVSFDINGGVTIENGATFADGDLTHTVAGNWTESGTGQRTGNGTIQMDASLIQSITDAATFYNLTFNGSGIGVMSGNVTIYNDFLIDNNTEVQSTGYHTIQGDFTVNDGSKYKATAGRVTFNQTSASQTIKIGTTDGEPNITFYQAYFDNGGSSNPKIIDGDMTVLSTFNLYDDAVIEDNGDTHTQTFSGDGYWNGTCNFSGTILFKGGTQRDTDDDDFTLGTADILVKGYTYIGDGDIMRINGNFTIDVNDDGNHIGFIVNDNAQLIGTSGHTLLIKANSSLYIRGANNFPTGFGTITFADGSYARYDASLNDQTIDNSVTYWHLYLNHGTSKTAAGNLDVNGNLYIYNGTEFKLGNYDMTLAGNIHNSDDSWGNGSLTATGGTVTFDKPDGDQVIDNAGTGTYTFNNLTFTNPSPTATHQRRIYDDLVVNGNFMVTNTGGDETNRLYIYLYDHEITGGSNFSLGANVWLVTSGANSFVNTIGSFSGTKSFDVNSTVRFALNSSGSTQQIPGGFTYGNIEIYGNGDKVPNGNLDINGNVSAVGYTPVFTDNSYQVNVAGDWKLSLNTTDLSGNSYIVFDGTDQIINSSHFANVYFINSGTKSINGTLDIEKDLVIQDNAVVEATDHYIYIAGNWSEQNSGQFTQTGAMTIFDGTAANQTVQTNSNSYFYSFRIDKPGSYRKVTFNSDIDVNGTFDFVEDNAELDLNGHNLHVARDFYFRENCIFSYNGGKVYFDGNDVAQLIRNYNPATIVFGDVEFLGTAVKRLYNNSFRFEGDVFINNATVDGQWWDHYVEGNWTNTGIFRHSSTLHFDGTQAQTISQSSFHSVRFGGGNYVKTLSGDIKLTGHLYIDDATLDVSPSNYSITLDNNWYNDSTGSFIAREGTVTINGEWSNIFTGESNTQYNGGTYLTTQGGTKSFYNLVINKNSNDYWVLLRGNLHVSNNLDIEQGDFRQSYDPNNYGINDIYISGNFISKGLFRDNNHSENIELNPSSGAHTFDPGTSTYGNLIFNGAAGTAYTLQNDLNLYSGRTITINNGDIDLNTHACYTNGNNGDITINNGSITIDEGAVLSLGNGATFTNNGGTVNLIGISSNPATLTSASGSFNYVQTAGTIAAQYYRIENISGNGIDIQGGSIDATNTFQNGNFSNGTGTAYLTVNGIDLGGDRTITGVVFNSGPTYNVQRTSGSGVLTFENATGTLAGEDHDNDDSDPGSHILWTYPGVVYWDGNTDGDGDNIHWNDPHNWANDAVPTIASMVILDHNAVSGSYSVDISNADANCKSLFINSGSNGITLTLNGHTLTIDGDITISSNSTLTQTNAGDTIIVAGSWSNEGTFNEGTATVVFNPATGTHSINTQGTGDPFNNIIIRGTDGKNVVSTVLDIDGDLTLQSGTLVGGSQTIYVAGNWTKNGVATFDYGTSTVIFDNNGNQSISGGEFYNFKTATSGTKTLATNIDVNASLTIGSGTVLDGGTNIIFVGRDWINEVGNSGFTQTGAGTVFFDGETWDQNIGSSSTQPTTFNILRIGGTRTKYTRQNVTVNADLIIADASLYITDGTTIDGAGANNTLNMGSGRIYVNGANNFPQNFETINLTGGTVDYYADIDQTVYPTTYYSLMVRRQHSGNNTTKTLAGDITVNNNLYINDDETLLDVDEHTINLYGNLSLATGGRQIDWGTAGTLIHFGLYWTVDADIQYLNNVIKKNRGHMRVRYHSLEIKGDLSILEDAYLQQDTVNITCSGTGKTFTLAPTAFVYSYNPATLGSETGRKAFPVGFANYNIHKDSRVYIRGSSDQTIYTVPNYGNLYIYTDATINVELDGDLDVEGSFIMNYDDPTLVDNGHNINVAGANIDLRTYNPSSSSTFTLDGQDQRLYDNSHGSNSIDLANVVFAGTGQKNLTCGGDDYYKITGDLTINSGVTVYTYRKIDFSGANWTNNGTFNHTGNTVYFTGNSAQTIDPGENNDFYSVSFSGSGTKTFVNHGIDVNNGTFTIENSTTVNMGSNLTHNIASERIINNGGTWTTDYANFIWDRNGTQYIPAMTAQNFILRKYDQWTRYRYLEGNININDLTIEEGVQLRCSQNSEASTPAYNVTMTGNFINNGTLYAWGNTFAFESNNTDAKIIKQGQGYFHNVTFNQLISGQQTRTYTLTEETRFYEDMTIGKNATLKLNGQILRLGNDDPDDPVEPDAEQHTIQADGTLEVDAGASLLFSCRDNGNPKLDVEGTLKVIGNSGSNAVISSQDWHTNSHRIDININSGGTIAAKYYMMQYLVDEGLYIDQNATIDATNNLSYGTFTNMNTSTSGTHYYLYCNADVSSIGSVDNVTFNFNGTPTPGVHFNVKRAAGSTGVLTFGGTASGLLAGETYEADPTGVNNSGSSLIEWPPISEVYWTGAVSTDWFDKDNWSPAQVPTNTINAVIPLRANNPVILGQNAVCKDLQITDGFLTLRSGWGITVSGNVYVGTGADVGILAVEDASCTITVSGNWTRGQNGLFVHGDGTVTFNATGGSISIDPRSSAFGNLAFNGGATFIITRRETFVDDNFTISNGTVQPSVNNYEIHIKGNYNNSGGTFDNTTHGTVLFDGSNNQTITNGEFWHVIVDGSGTKTTAGNCVIDGTLKVNNGTFKGGVPIDMNGNVTIEASGTFDDGGNTHTFSGYTWEGTGGYTGNGIIQFDRNGYQYVKEAKFNTLELKNNGAVILNGDIDMTGDLKLIEPNTYLNVQEYQVTNTTGTGTFYMGDARRIYVRGANNYPAGFANYDLHENSYSIYDGTMEQTIAPIPVIYGRLYLYHSNKIMGGHLDIDGLLYFYGDASLDVTSNNYRINIEGHWYNQYGATFNPRQGEVIFDGNNENTYMYIYDASKNTNPFYNLTVNKGTGAVRSNWTDITVQNDLKVINGYFYQNQTMYVGGNFTAFSGTFGTGGTYYLNKTSGSANVQLNGSRLYNLTINSGAKYTLQDDMEMNGQFNLIAGTFDANGKTVRMGDYGEVHEISGTYILGAGGILKLPNYGTFKVNSGGEVQVVGEPNNVATVTSYSGRYYFNIENGGTIKARNYLFEYMAENGIYIKNGGIIDNAYNLSYGTFTNPANGGACLRIENTQNFTEIAGNPIVEVSFPINPGGGAANVTKTVATSGQLDFKNYSGEFAGEDYDNDPDNLVNWISPPYVMWTGNIDNDWYKIGNWEVSSGPDRIPLISDNVIITKRTNQPIIDHDGAVAKTLDIQDNAILTLNSSAATDTTLKVAEDVSFTGTVVMTSGNDTLAVGGGWINNGMFIPGQGAVIMNSSVGLKSIDNRVDKFYNLIIDTRSSIQLAHSTTVDNDFIIRNGTFDMANNNYILTVNGDFTNMSDFVSRNAKVVFAGSTNQNFKPGNSDYYTINIDNNSASVTLLGDLSVTHNLNINSGTLDLNHQTLNFGDGNGTDVLTIAGGTLNINDNAYFKPANNSSIEVNNGGTFKIIGTDLDNLGYMISQSGNYAFNVNSGGTIQAMYYSIQNTDINGIRVKGGATIDATNNFSYGIWRNGTNGGQFLWLENDFSDFTVKNVYFWSSASYNVKRLSGSGIITFEDALGSIAGENFEIDNPANGAETGKIHWTFTHDQYVWTGAVDENWHVPQNWDVPTSVDPSGHAVPNSSGIARIPDVSIANGGSGNFPILGINTSVGDGECYDLIIEAGATLTINNSKNLDVDNSVTVQAAGTLTVANGSVSNISVGDIWSVSGTFNHGGSSTVTFDAPAGKLVTISGNSRFYNLTINSTGTAEYLTGSSLNMDGSFNLLAGILTVSNTTDTLFVAGDFNSSATFNNGNGVVVLNGDNQSITNTGTGNFYKVYIAGTLNKTLASDITIENDLIILNGATLNGANYNLSLYGDWVNRGTFNAASSTLKLLGSTTQLIDNYNDETFYNLEINNTASTFPQIILYGNVRIGGTNWTMTDGVIETSAEHMLTVGTNVSLTGGDTENSYVSGPVTKEGLANFIFPIGDGNKFARIGISGMSNTAIFVAQYHEAPYSDITNVGTGIDHVSGYEYWTLNRTAGTGEPYVTLFWEDGAESGIDNLSTLSTAIYTAGQWENQGNSSTSGTIAKGSITSGVKFSNFGPVTFASTNDDNPLHSYTRWTGAVSTVWNNPNNWTRGVPTATIDALIPASPANQPVIDVNAVVKKLTIDQNASVTINPLKSLTVKGKFYLNGNLTLKSDANGNACFINEKTISYGTNCEIYNELYLSAGQYHYISTDMDNCNSERFKNDPFQPYYNHNFYNYVESGSTWNLLNEDWFEYDGNLQPMTGYAFYGDKNITVSLTRSQSGNFYSSDRSLTLYYTGNTEVDGGGSPDIIHRGWNFVGNPFPAYLDWDAAGWTKTNIYNSIYFWNGTNYSYYVSSGSAQDGGTGTNNATNIIPPKQGYFVKVIEDGANPDDNQTGLLTTPTSARTTNTQAFWKNPYADNLDEIRLTAHGNGFDDETVIRFKANATDNFDANYDAFKLFSPTPGIPQIYSVVATNDTILASINTYSQIRENLIVHVGFNANTEGDYTITVNNFSLQDNHDAFFEDTYTGKTYDLHNLNYSFHSQAGQFDDRFVVKFSENATEIKETVQSDLPNVSIYTAGDYIYLKSNAKNAVIGKLTLYDVTGKPVEVHYNNQDLFAQIRLSCPNGVYVAVLQTSEGIYKQKLIIIR